MNDFFYKIRTERVIFGFKCCNKLDGEKNAVRNIKRDLGAGALSIFFNIHHSEMFPIKNLFGSRVEE